MTDIFIIRVDHPDHYSVHSIWDDRGEAVHTRDRLNEESEDYEAIIEVWELNNGQPSLPQTLKDGVSK